MLLDLRRDMLPKNFYQDVEKPNFLKYILYSDTDSIFIVVPFNVTDTPLDQRWKLAEEAATGINNAIQAYLNNYILPKCNIDPSQNKTFFKTEMVFDSILFLDVKKNYAYKLLIKEGKVIPNPEVKYTGIQVKKSNTATLTKDLLKEMIEGISLNSEIPNSQRINKLTEAVNKYHQIFLDDIKSYNFEKIGLPVRWQKGELAINGMKVYNFIMGKETFSHSSAGRFIYCRFQNTLKLKALQDIEFKGITVPFVYNHLDLQEKMKQFGIEIDGDKHWDTLFTTTCQRVIEVVKTTK